MGHRNATRIGAIVMALLAGVLFSLGLVISGMSQPEVVLGFLDVKTLVNGVKPWSATGWDPSLMLVMAGALLVTVYAFAMVPKKQRRPWHEDHFKIPNRKDIDMPLVGGALMFGVGWGLAGYCPGPALVSVFMPSWDGKLFFIFMLIGMLAAKIVAKKTK